MVKDFCVNALPSNVSQLRHKLTGLKAAVEGNLPVQSVKVIFKLSGVMAMYRCADSVVGSTCNGSNGVCCVAVTPNWITR